MFAWQIYKYMNVCSYTKRTMTLPLFLLLYRIAVTEVKALACAAANHQPEIYLNGNFLSFQMINGLCLSRKTSGANIPIERVDLTMR